ncbi:unnamed protein product [Urochloa humidicola]
MASPAMFTLISSDGERFEVTEAAVNMSQTIRHMIEDGCADGGIPLPNVTAKALAAASSGGAAAASSGEAAGGSDASAGNKDGGDDLASFDKEFVNVD